LRLELITYAQRGDLASAKLLSKVEVKVERKKRPTPKALTQLAPTRLRPGGLAHLCRSLPNGSIREQAVQRRTSNVEVRGGARRSRHSVPTCSLRQRGGKLRIMKIAILSFVWGAAVTIGFELLGAPNPAHHVYELRMYP
jgi:hypothetical protein